MNENKNYDSEMLEIWLEEFFDNEIKEAEANNRNNELWLKGCSTPEEQAEVISTINTVTEYIEVLRDLKRNTLGQMGGK